MEKENLNEKLAHEKRLQPRTKSNVERHFTRIKELIYKQISLEKAYKFFERLSNILHRFQVNGPIKVIEYTPHKVQRITGVHTISEPSLYIAKNNKPSIYFSKSNQLSSVDVYLLTYRICI